MSTGPGRERGVSSESQTWCFDSYLVHVRSSPRNCSLELPRDGIPEMPGGACSGPAGSQHLGSVLSTAKQSEDTLQEPGLLSRAFLKP